MYRAVLSRPLTTDLASPLVELSTGELTSHYLKHVVVVGCVDDVGIANVCVGYLMCSCSSSSSAIVVLLQTAYFASLSCSCWRHWQHA